MTGLIAAGVPRLPTQPAAHKLVFIKTHKTGSSTITNLFHRFGYKYVWGRRDFHLPTTMSAHFLCNLTLLFFCRRYGLNFALPIDNMFYGWPMKGEPSVNNIEPIGVYQVLRMCSQQWWNASAFVHLHCYVLCVGTIRYLRFRTCGVLSRATRSNRAWGNVSTS